MFSLAESSETRGNKLTNETLLKLENISKVFKVRDKYNPGKPSYVHAVDSVNLAVRKGETLGIVGESGCGKTTTGRIIMRLLDASDGKIFYRGTDLTALKGKPLLKMRKKIQMVFQDPYASLNPRLTIAENVGEPLIIHKLSKSRADREEKVKQLLDHVGLDPGYYARYPFEFSGGQRQRIGIARALAVEPEIIIADEPVSALDVSLQAQVINLMQDLKQKNNLTYIFIAHDLSVVKHISDRIAVMYLGRVVELADKRTLFNNPMHPYTQALLSAIPVPTPGAKADRIVLQGDVPSPVNPPGGCPFHPRCSKAFDTCRERMPELKQIAEGHSTACHLYE